MPPDNYIFNTALVPSVKFGGHFDRNQDVADFLNELLLTGKE